MFKILKYFKPSYWGMTAIIFVLTVIGVVCELGIVSYMEKILALVLELAPISSVLPIGGIMLALCAGSVVSNVLIGFFASKIAAGFSRDLRKKLFDKVSSFTMEEINKFSTASLITRSTNDIQQVQMAIAICLRMALTAPIMAIASIIMIIGKNWQLTLTTAVGIIVLIISIVVIFALVMPKFKKIQTLTDRLNGVTRENLTGLRVVRAYNAEEYQQAKFEKVNTELTGTHRFVTIMMGILMPGCQAVMNILSLSIIWIGAYLINNSVLSLPEMTAFQIYASMILMSFMMLTIIFVMIPRASVSANRIKEVLETEPKVVDTENPVAPSADTIGKVEFRNVSFRYPDAEGDVINDISFTLNKGETLAIIGSTGSGKSTLINLIPRFYDATQGEVLVDDINVKDYNQKDLHDKLGFVPQKATLFSGSIESNIKFSDRDMSDEQMREAAEIAQAEDFINEKEDKYSSRISQGGKNVSGGQKQRLSIARAIAKDPEIFIFDDSFSALDYKTDKTLRKALSKKTENAGVIIVAQRIGTIINADKIIVLDKGRMVGMGKHKELLKDCEVYREIALSQLSKEELDNAGTAW